MNLHTIYILKPFPAWKELAGWLGLGRRVIYQSEDTRGQMKCKLMFKAKGGGFKGFISCCNGKGLPKVLTFFNKHQSFWLAWFSLKCNRGVVWNGCINQLIPL